MKKLLVLGAFAVAGCKYIPVHMHTESHVQHLDGTVEHKSSDWEGTLDELPAQLEKAGSELATVTSKMVKELTDVPPPGSVELKDLSPDLEKHQGKRGRDFLIAAKDDDGKPIKFEYVRIGVASYDDFFKTAQELYALVYETTQVIGQMRKVSSKLLDTKVDAEAELHGLVSKAKGVKGETELSATLTGLEDIARTLGVLVPEIGKKIGKLVQTGEALIAGAASSITNPKVVTHLGLIKDGLLSSIHVVKESGVLVVKFTKDLAGFG
jgi:hypothetical protein